MKLEGKVALVTGAGRGIGEAIAERLARDGADIVIDDRSFEHGPAIGTFFATQAFVRHLRDTRRPGKIINISSAAWRVYKIVGRRADLAAHISYCDQRGGRLLLAIPAKDRLERVLRYLLIEALERRLAHLFLPAANGRRPCHGEDLRFAADPLWRDLVLFYEYFHGDTGRGLGASHQTGWTALAAGCITDVARRRAGDRSAEI